MRKPSSFVTTAVVVLACAVVWAQVGEDKKTEASPPAEGIQPPPELQQYSYMIGSWKCEGEGTSAGQPMKATGNYNAEWGLDNFWVVAHYDGKAVGAPGAHKGMDIYGYDVGSKMFVMTGVDNLGILTTGKSKGWDGDRQEWTGKATVAGKDFATRWTVVKRSDKEIAISATTGSDSFENTCRK